MNANHPGSVRKPICMFLSLLAVLLIGLGIYALGRSARPGITFASENEKADANERAADANEQAEPNEAEVRRPDHNHPAFSERVEERARMVTRDIKGGWMRDHVREPNVLAAMRTVPRHAFVRKSDLRQAYADRPLPIGLGQTISQPYIVAYMTETLKLDPNSKVLEVGTGSGYQAAVCAEIAREVYTIEILEKLAKSGKERLKKLGYHNVFVKAADGYYGWQEKGPFDAIIVTCAAGFVPPPLVKQLKPGGRMILPRGSPYGSQWLVLVTKDDKGKVKTKRLMGVRFVPMTGRVSKTR
ncbi:MAG: protein-L-isoaspartate(D-aspartate) O-methyltransferase [Planctomycetota bacterium]